jgi:spermidine synthase
VTRVLALALTGLTGFSGLVYEVAWEKYLATLLGSHSEATAAVLGIFLGGLSVGYALFGRWTRVLVARGRGPALLAFYGLVEGAIGLYVLVFPYLFIVARDVSTLFSPEAIGLGFLFDVLLAAILIGPPSVLMGGTIPILTQALSQNAEESTRFHALVYAVNTTGAFVGALAAGFYLVPTLGLVIVMRSMGVINLSAGATFGLLGLIRMRAAATSSAQASESESNSSPSIDGFYRYAAASLLIGFAMMALQTVIIRIGGLSLGASQFTFSMVVAVFVLCIALGSTGVSMARRIPNFALSLNLWSLVAVLLVLYQLLPTFPYGAHVLRTLIRSSDPAFYLYQATIFLALLLMIGPAVVLSGASLPLLFHQLRGQVGDLGSVAGRLYSWNTAGSLLGAVLGGYVLLFWLDLDQVYSVAVFAVVIAAVIATLGLDRRGRPKAIILATISMLCVIGSSGWPPEYFVHGLFRYRTALARTFEGPTALFEAQRPNMLFYEDGPTSSVAVVAEDFDGKPSRSIINNGKPDGNTVADYETMSLAALIPALMAEKTTRAFVIGFGTGISVGELAAIPEMEEVVVSEISPAVMRAAPLFDGANLDVSTNTKVRVMRTDAYRALLRTDKRFDVVVSEPSNPWMAGVEMLYSREFLAAARQRLAPGGVYAQWFHLYETDDRTVELVLRTYLEVFDEVSVWYGNATDLIVLGFESGDHAKVFPRLRSRAMTPPYRAALARVGVTSLPQLVRREIIPVGVLHAASLQGPIHTLLKPILGYTAARAFFRGGEGHVPFTGFGKPAVLGERGTLSRNIRRAKPSAADFSGACAKRANDCVALLSKWLSTAEDPSTIAPWVNAASQINLLGGSVDSRLIAEVALLHGTPADAPRTDDVPIELARRATQNYVRYYSHAAPFSPRRLIDLWTHCKAPVDRPAACLRGKQRAIRLVQQGVPAR